MSGKVTANLGRASGLSKVVTAAGGKILQVVAGTSATEVSISGTSFADSGLDVAITPSASSSLVFVLACFGVYQQGGYHGYITIFRDSTDLALGVTQAMIDSNSQDTDGTISVSSSVQFLDSPSSTSELTYSVYAKVQTAGQATAIVNGSPVNSIIAMEIDGS